MTVAADDGRRYWEPGRAPFTVGFTEERVASIITRGNRLVPEIVARRVPGGRRSSRASIELLITNQPNPIFLRNWREALELPPACTTTRSIATATCSAPAIPINLEDALDRGQAQRRRHLLALGGFSHAGDYAAAAVMRWQAGDAPD